MKRKIIQDNKKGFTLVEVIISIAIIGMIVVPISTIFIGTLNQIVDARKILNATQLAQLCVENMKAKSENELMEIFSYESDDLLGEKMIQSEQSDLLGLDRIPDGYSIKLGYNKNNPIFQDEAYKNQISSEEIDFDARITFHSGMERDFLVSNGEEEKRYRPNMSVSDRVIYIQYKDEGNAVYIKDGALATLHPFGVKEGVPLSIMKNFFAIKIDCLDNDIRVPDLQTRIYVQNESSIPVKLYIYQGKNSSVNLTINDQNGSYSGQTITYYNVPDENQATEKIYEISVEVYDKRGDLLTRVEATKIDE